MASVAEAQLVCQISVSTCCRELQALPVGSADFLDEAFIKRRRIVHTRERLSQLADGALNVRHPQPCFRV